MTKILIIGDLHIQCSNILQIDIFLSELKIYLKKNKFDFIVSAGDLLHTHERIHTIALNKAIEFLGLLTQHSFTYVLVGNHDLKSNQEFMTKDGSWLTCLETYPNLKVVYKSIIVKKDNKTFTFCPYVPEKRFMEALNSLEDNDWMKSNCVFAHQTFDGAKMGSIITENVENWKEEYPLCISGHIHTRQWVKKNLLYVGSSLQHSFGETDKKSLTVLDTDINECSQIFLNLPIKKTIYLNLTELKSFDIKRIQDKTNFKEYKIVVNGENETDISVWKSFQKSSEHKKIVKCCKIVFKPNKTNLSFLISNKPENSRESFKERLINNVKKDSNQELTDLMNKLIH